LNFLLSSSLTFFPTQFSLFFLQKKNPRSCLAAAESICPPSSLLNAVLSEASAPAVARLASAAGTGRGSGGSKGGSRRTTPLASATEDEAAAAAGGDASAPPDPDAAAAFASLKAHSKALLTALPALAASRGFARCWDRSLAALAAAARSRSAEVAELAPEAAKNALLVAAAAGLLRPGWVAVEDAAAEPAAPPSPSPAGATGDAAAPPAAPAAPAAAAPASETVDLWALTWQRARAVHPSLTPDLLLQ